MKVTVNFINYRLQERLIEMVRSEGIYHRVKANRTIEFAKKWQDKIFDLCIEIMFDLFEHLLLFTSVEPSGYKDFSMELCQHNLPFYTFIINESYTIVVSKADSEYIADHIKPPKISFSQ